MMISRLSRSSIERLRRLLLSGASVVLGVAVLGVPCSAGAQGPDALTWVRTAVNSELTANKEDHSAWDYRDHDVQPGTDKISEVIETPHGNLSRMLVLNGHPLTDGAEQAEVNRLRGFVNSPSEQAKRRRDGAHDDAQASELLQMLPNAFLWEIAGENPEAVTLKFRPNPSFDPPDMQSRVLGVMAGEMVIARDGNRIQTLRGTLTQEVKIGFGILGKLDQGGTFDVERRQVAPGHWAITETHVHIGGRALLFKTIGQQEDETKTDWHPSTAPNLQVALEQILR